MHKGWAFSRSEYLIALIISGEVTWQGMQNIVEGSMASGTSKKTELKLEALQGPVWKNCSTTTRTFSAKPACHNGERITQKRKWSVT